jgi:hypothetical protein
MKPVTTKINQFNNFLSPIGRRGFIKIGQI